MAGAVERRLRFMSAKAAKSTPGTPAAEDDPVARALANAPIDSMHENETARRAVAEARTDIAAGRTYSGEEVSAMLEQWRLLGRPPSDEEFHAMLEERGFRPRRG
jgi:hypothetical protein